jgi:hypothetical protein
MPFSQPSLADEFARLRRSAEADAEAARGRLFAVLEVLFLTLIASLCAALERLVLRHQAGDLPPPRAATPRPASRARRRRAAPRPRSARPRSARRDARTPRVRAPVARPARRWHAAAAQAGHAPALPRPSHAPARAPPTAVSRRFAPPRPRTPVLLRYQN